MRCTTYRGEGKGARRQESEARRRIIVRVCRLLASGSWLLLLILQAVAGCTQQMADQPRYDPLQRSDFFPDRLSARPLPPGTIPRDYMEKDGLLASGFVNGQPAKEFPFPITRNVLERGQQRYNVYCTPCHDHVGTGNGMAARRGFRRPPASFHTEELRSSPPGHFFDVITNGFGAMPSYANQIEVNDRWAIVGYIRALQLSQWATAADVPADERRRLEAEPR